MVIYQMDTVKIPQDHIYSL